MFGGMFDRVHSAEGEGALYSEDFLRAEAERMKEKEKESPFYEPPEPTLAESLQEMIEQKQVLTCMHACRQAGSLELTGDD